MRFSRMITVDKSGNISDGLTEIDHLDINMDGLAKTVIY